MNRHQHQIIPLEWSGQQTPAPTHTIRMNGRTDTSTKSYTLNHQVNRHHHLNYMVAEPRTSHSKFSLSWKVQNLIWYCASELEVMYAIIHHIRFVLHLGCIMKFTYQKYQVSQSSLCSLLMIQQCGVQQYWYSEGHLWTNNNQYFFCSFHTVVLLPLISIMTVKHNNAFFY